MSKYPLEIGGRDIDLTQIGTTLRMELREAFPINEVPVELVQKVNALIDSLSTAERDIELFIDSVRHWHGDFLLP